MYLEYRKEYVHYFMNRGIVPKKICDKHEYILFIISEVNYFVFKIQNINFTLDMGNPEEKYE